MNELNDPELNDPELNDPELNDPDRTPIILIRQELLRHAECQTLPRKLQHAKQRDANVIIPLTFAGRNYNVTVDPADRFTVQRSDGFISRFITGLRDFFSRPPRESWSNIWMNELNDTEPKLNYSDRAPIIFIRQELLRLAECQTLPRKLQHAKQRDAIVQECIARQKASEESPFG
ncbi:hypothetical protein EO087_13395 [Dyella sp. M7H15-1]|uniref:hypothetical protein n=1 Tax=Dyella sp. M7H15-1 TaxID=2501295 RepID=UPI001005043A|nr:hypothetical protein [Dyella sp. M7H15-1]QAU24860.1 hypothetical protein EO087_13395 [Dyella sp. M7H15-1]